MRRRLTEDDKRDMKDLRDLLYQQLNGEISREEFLTGETEIRNRERQLRLAATEERDDD